MLQTIQLLPGVTLRCATVQHFKQGCLSLQFLRPMCREEAAMNALIPAVLLRGTVQRPDLRALTLHLDDLYGASVGELIRRVSDYQTMGLACGFIDDRYTLSGDRVLEPMIDLVRELLLEPVMDGEGFSCEFVESEKRNLIATIESQRNDKRAYTATQMIKKMCEADSFGIPRLGEKEQVAAIEPVAAYRHYRKVLKESPLEIFYVGSADPQEVARLLQAALKDIPREPITLPDHTPFCDGGGGRYTEVMDVTQGKLSMGFLTPITNRRKDFITMQVFNTIFGAGMTSKLFMNIREKQSLCYSIGSGYYGSKGILTVSAGIDFSMEEQVIGEVLHQLEECQKGNITPQELKAAKEADLSALRSIYDTPGGIESYESGAAIGKVAFTLEEYCRGVEEVTLEQVVEAAKTLTLHTTYFLKGVEQ